MFGNVANKRVKHSDNFISSSINKQSNNVSAYTSSQIVTAFRTSTGLYQFTRLVMGLKNSPATFQRLMECIFRGRVN